MSGVLTALAAFQDEATSVKKDEENPFFKSSYASLTTIMKTIRPVLAKHGLYITQLPDQSSIGEPALTTILFHPSSGEEIRTTTPLSLVKKDPQAQGSAITYLRRYSLAAILQIVIDEDDDGNKASEVSDQYEADSSLEPQYINEKAIGILKDDIKKTLNTDQQKAFKTWLKDEKFFVDGDWQIKDNDLEGIYTKISVMKEPI